MDHTTDTTTLAAAAATGAASAAPSGAATVATAAPSRSGTNSASPGTGRRWRSTELLGHSQEVEIEHGSSVYRLRLTGMGKLILTK